MATRRLGKNQEMKIYLPEGDYFRLERILTANFSRKPSYGLRSQLVSAIIKRFIDETEAKIASGELPNLSELLS